MSQGGGGVITVGIFGAVRLGGGGGWCLGSKLNMGWWGWLPLWV